MTIRLCEELTGISKESKFQQLAKHRRRSYIILNSFCILSIMMCMSTASTSVAFYSCWHDITNELDWNTKPKLRHINKS